LHSAFLNYKEKHFFLLKIAEFEQAVAVLNSFIFSLDPKDIARVLSSLPSRSCDEYKDGSSQALEK